MKERSSNHPGCRVPEESRHPQQLRPATPATSSRRRSYDDADYADTSSTALYKAMGEGRLILCECVLAELRPALSEADLRSFLKEWRLEFIPSTLESALLAGKHFEYYLKRGGREGRVMPDFLIGAHAQIHADRLLARDRGYLRDYFKGLKVIMPA
ncbi:MAG: type II toxin-antitoxin system VapC family toxin [bacterium]